MSKSSAWVLLYACALIATLVVVAEGGIIEKCTDGTARELYTPKSALVLHNLTITVHPRYPDGTVYRAARGTVQLRGFHEIYRESVGYLQCYEPSGFPAPASDGIQLFRNISVDQLDCEYLNEISVVDGVTLNVTVTKMTHPDWPAFRAYINLTVSDGNVSFPLAYSPTQGEHYMAHHVEGIFKYSIGVENWPWEDTSGKSYLDHFWSIPDLTLPSYAVFGSDRVGNITRVWAQTADGTVRFEQTIEQVFVLDDQIFVRSNSSDRLIPAFPLPTPWLPDAFKISMALCDGTNPPGFQWSRYLQDPTLSMLFTPPPEPLAPNAPVDKHKKGVVVAAVVVPVVLGVLFLGLLAAFAIKPELKNVFRPYRRRNETSPAPLG